MTTTQAQSEVGRQAQPKRQQPPSLDRDNIPTLDRALYVASCFAASAITRRVTIVQIVERGKLIDRYRVLDGRWTHRSTKVLGAIPLFVMERSADA